jgi:replicative DNA helicase
MTAYKDDNERLQHGVLSTNPEADAQTTSIPPTEYSLITLQDAFAEAFETIKKRASGEEKPIKTPWKALNEHLRGGLWPGLHVLVGSSGTGKTQFAMQIAILAAESELKHEKRPVIYIALELGNVDLISRLIGLLSHEPRWKEKNGRSIKWSEIAYPANDEKSESLENAIKLSMEFEATIKQLPLKIEIGPPRGWNYSRLVEIAEKEKPRLIVLDYAQIVRGNDREDIRQVISGLAYEARAIARKYGTTVLMVSSVARDKYAEMSGKDKAGKETNKDALGAGDPSRFIGMGKESGELEYAADCVYALCQEPWSQGQNSRTTWLAIAKGRGFGPGWVELKFDGARFSDRTEHRTLANRK